MSIKILTNLFFILILYTKTDKKDFCNEKNTDNFIMHIHLWRIDRAQCIIQHEHTYIS